ncbi:MAG TPA: glycerol-3-phosphate dehydrogenase/oxidase [Geminicoccaceae bacterium]|nr:glycerol-3-phosphate dehydrogenase/oxidase [Geminicoccaceae bacterium]
MERDLPALARGEFDLVVIGGGVFGAAATLDAAQRGLKVALVERTDFAGATSAHSFKMIHGGIRYLQHGDVRRVRHSARARAAFLRVAPHLAHPLPIVVPTYGRGMRGKTVLRLGMAAYDLLTADRNRGIADRTRRIPNGRFLGRDEVLRRYPGMDPYGLTGAGVFCDGQMHNPPRLVLAFVQSAAEAGAVCANHVEATGLLQRAGRVTGVQARDALTGDRLEVRARFVLNAAGPYAEAVLAGGLGRGLAPATPFSRDAYFVVRRPLVEGDHALTLPSLTSDPDAILSRGARHLFLVPWHGATLVGVWHKVYRGHPDAYEITEAELEAWTGEINLAYGGLGLTPDDVALGSAGLVPFGENDPDAAHLKFAHRSRIVDHARERGLEGLLTLIGVRYTTGPVEAVEAVDLVCGRLPRAAPPSRLAATPVRGGGFDDFEALVARFAREAPEAIRPASLRAVVHNHGTAAADLLARTQRRPDWARPLPGCDVLEVEIAHAARSEMAMTLADAVFRRTDLCTLGHPGEAPLRAAARVMAACRGWDDARQAAELDDVRRRLRLARTGRALLADAPPPPALVA